MAFSVRAGCSVAGGFRDSGRPVPNGRRSALFWNRLLRSGGQVDTRKDEPPRVAVIGGGISGLAAAYRLRELQPSWRVELFESQGRLGGVIRTVHQDGYCIELGPDSFVTQVPWGLEFCRKLGFEEELIGTNEAHRQAYVVSRGRLHLLPPGLMLMAPSRIWPLVVTPLISVRGKLRMCCEPFIPRRTDGQDESLAEFARRRFGREVFERLMQPLASGIYMSDPERLSMQAAFPQFVQMERRYGSLIRAARDRVRRMRQRRPDDTGPRYSLFVTARRGLSTLVEAIRATLTDVAIRLRSPVEGLQRTEDGRWRLTVASGAEPALPEVFDGVVLAVPAAAACRLLASADEPLADLLGQIRSSGCVVVTFAFERSWVRHPLNGFGFVVPLCEGRDVVACTFSSVKYEGRAPEGRVLLRAFLGGACRAHVMELEDAELTATAYRELDELLGLAGEPLLSRVERMPGAMPQYEVNHLKRVQAIEERVAALPGLAIAGNAFRGVGIPYCIHTGERAAEQLVGKLQGIAAQPAAETPVPARSAQRRA
ncbi:MAG TPA: protoporphyrinogen oxidase, partial [Planctomycetaceae bacterium]|nr:protoporphyrinogen oxidase [Planctomycetaceae bacterium]